MRKGLHTLVVAIGFLQVVGFLVGSKSIRGLGMAYCSSPLPIVFTEVKGVETFASDFFIRFRDGNVAEEKSIQITPEVYQKLKGPYNRRNVYGAAISYGPVLPDSLWKSVLNYGICEGTLAEELGLPQKATEVEILIKSKTAGSKEEWVLKVDCP